MGYFSSLHLELTLMGEFENPNSPYYDYDPAEDEYPEYEAETRFVKKDQSKKTEEYDF